MKTLKSLVTMLTFSLVSLTLHAADVHVSPTGSGDQSGSDADNAIAGIQAGVTAATAGTTVWLADGTYTLAT